MASLNEWIERAGDRLGSIAAVEKVESLIESLSPRDRRLLTGLVVFFLVALFAGASYLVRGVLEKSEGQIAYRTDQLLRAQDIVMESQALRSRVEAAEQSLGGEANFIIQSFIERQAQAAGITQDKVPSIQVRSDIPGERYKETLVEVQLKDIDLDALVRFLHSVEYGARPVHVKELRVRTGRRDRAQLDVDLELTVVSLINQT